jgi:hypothetical protein
MDEGCRLGLLLLCATGGPRQMCLWPPCAAALRGCQGHPLTRPARRRHCNTLHSPSHRRHMPAGAPGRAPQPYLQRRCETPKLRVYQHNRVDPAPTLNHRASDDASSPSVPRAGT